MNIKKLFSGCLLIAGLAFSTNIALAENDITKTENYLPGGKYRIFGPGRGTVANVSNNIRMSGGFSQNVGNLAIQQSVYRGNLSYTQDFSNHPHWEHGAGATSAHQNFHSKKGQIVNGSGATLTDVSVTAYEIHPADAYDGEQGGGFPVPTGARDEYSYLVNGKSVSIRTTNPKDLPPKATDDKLLHEVGIDPAPYNQSNINDRPIFEKKILVDVNAGGDLVGYNGGAENSSIDIAGNNGDWNSVDISKNTSPFYENAHDERNNDTNGVDPFKINYSSYLTQDSSGNSFDNGGWSSAEVKPPESSNSFLDALWGGVKELASGARDYQADGAQWSVPVGAWGDGNQYAQLDPYAPSNSAEQFGANVAAIGSMLGSRNPASLGRHADDIAGAAANMAKKAEKVGDAATDVVGTGLKYEPAPYHSKTGNNVKSPAPTNGQYVLNNSVPIGNNTSRRVGVDKTTGEYVVFDKHADGIYHGHTRPWNGEKGTTLTTQMKNALINAGLTNRKGKIQ